MNHLDCCKEASPHSTVDPHDVVGRTGSSDFDRLQIERAVARAHELRARHVAQASATLKTRLGRWLGHHGGPAGANISVG